MSHAMPRESIRYVAEIDGVREVTLVGGADLAYWRERLGAAGLQPYAAGGQAELVISATAARWRGARFRELSFSVAVSARADGATHDGFYLARAYNSVRAFAWVERTLFTTPYYYGQLAVEAHGAAAVALHEAGQPAFRAAMVGARSPSAQDDQLWEGPIWLPGSRGGAADRLFYARLGGDTALYPFATGADTLDLRRSDRAPIFGQLIESRFAPREWRIRTAAHHAKSKTYRLEKV